jgi:hypothetical protein
MKQYNIPYLIGLHAEGLALPFYSTLLACLGQFISLVVAAEKTALSNVQDVVTTNDRYLSSRISPYFFPEFPQYGASLKFEEEIREIKSALKQYSIKWKLAWKPSATVQSLDTSLYESRDELSSK